MTVAPAVRGRLLARNALLQVAGQALPLAVGLATMPFVVRGLGPDRFGLLSLAWTLISYFTIFDLGMGRAATKHVSDSLATGQESAIPSVVWSAISVQVALGTIGAIVLAAVGGWLVEHALKMPPALVREARVSVYVLACSVPIYLVSGSLRGILEAALRFDLVNAVRAPFLASYFVMPLVGVMLGLGLPAIVGLLIASAAAATVAYGWACMQLFPSLAGRPRIRGADFRKLLGYGSWVSVTSVVAPILVQLDRFMIGALLSVTAVGYYSASYEMVTRLWIVPSSLSATLFPAFSALGAGQRHEQVSRLVQRSLRHVLVTLGPAVALLIPFSRDVVSLLFGAAYATKSVGVMQILALGVLVNSTAFVPAAVSQALGRPDLPAKFHLVEVPVHVLLLWWLTKTFGIGGAALAWSIRAALDVILQFAGAARLAALPRRWMLAERIPQILAFLAAVGVCAAGVAAWAGALWLRLGLLGLLVGMVGVTTWHYLLDQDEKNGLARLLRVRST